MDPLDTAASDAAATARPITPSLFAFAIFYGGMVCIAGVLGNKQVAFGPFAVEAGIFAFLMLVATSSAVAELHGRETANRLVIIGFVPLLISLLLTLLVLALPASKDMQPERLAAFDTMMGATPRIWIGGIIAYGTSTLLNVAIFSRLKNPEGGFQTNITDLDTGQTKRLDVAITSRSNPGLWIRSAIASMASQVVDTLIFIAIAFYGVFPIGELLVGQMLAKVVLSAVLVPLLILLLVRIGRQLDCAKAV